MKRPKTHARAKKLRTILRQLSEQADALIDGAMDDDRDDLLQRSSEDLRALRDAIDIELSGRIVCEEAELAARVEDEARGVWERVTPGVRYCESKQ